MQGLVIYDSNFGHTKIIAEAILKGLGTGSKVLSVSGISLDDYSNIDLVIVGSPIVAWKPTERMANYLNSLKHGQLKGIKAATFDTRVKLFIHGDAAKKISLRLQEAGADIIVPPQAFYVKGKEGPLFEGEENRATAWAESLYRFVIR